MAPHPSTYGPRMLDAARVCLVVTAASLPFSTAATNAFAVFAMAFWLLSGQWRPAMVAVRAEPVAWIGCVLFAWLAAGMAWSLAPAREAAHVLLKYRVLLLFAVTVYLCADVGWRERVLGVFLASSIVLLTLSYGVWFGVIHYADDRAFSRADNAILVKHAITHGFIVGLLAYGTAVLALRESGWRRWALVALSVGGACNVWFAVQGRTGYVVLAVLVLWLAYARWSVRGIAIATLALAVLLVSALQWASTFQKRVEQATTEAQDYERHDENGETSVGLRLHFWKRSSQWLARHPILGAGTGGWSEAYYEATRGDAAYLHDRRHMHPHNEYVHLAVQLGVAGFALFVGLLVVAFHRARALPGIYSSLATGFVLAFAVGSLFNDMLIDTTEAHMWAILGGALFGALRTPRDPAQ